MWGVQTAMTEKQTELSKAGVKCNDVAAGVLKLAFDAGLEKYVYHRPAHGAGMEGHQAPYISPGDQTVLEENMIFSNEPGLYNAGAGYASTPVWTAGPMCLHAGASILPLGRDKGCWFKL